MSAHFKNLLEILASLSIIGGVGIYFFLDYRETERARIERSLDFATLLQSNEARAASFDLFEPWRSYDLSTLNAVGPGRAVIEKFIRDVVTATDGLEEKIYETTSFYDTLNLCIENGACDEATAQGLLGEGAFDFYCLYRPIIEEMRRGSRVMLGAGLEEFATRRGPCTEEAAAEQDAPSDAAGQATAGSAG